MNFVKYHMNRLWFKITRNPLGGNVFFLQKKIAYAEMRCCLATMSQQTKKATGHKRFDFMQIEEDFD